MIIIDSQLVIVIVIPSGNSFWEPFLGTFPGNLSGEPTGWGSHQANSWGNQQANNECGGTNNQSVSAKQ